MRHLALLVSCLIALAGCAEEADFSDAGAPAPVSEAVAVVGVEAAGLQAAADAAAQAWNPLARLLLVATFEGELADYAQDRWIAPHIDNAGPVADGLSLRWSFSYALDTPLNDAVDQAAALAGGPGVRIGYVVTVDETGRVVDEYETQDDDEGVPALPFLDGEFIGSAEAAAVAAQAHGISRYADLATFGMTFLGVGEFSDGPEWVFAVSAGEVFAIAVVDAVTGELVMEADE